MRAQPPPVSAGGLTPERRHAGRYALERELGRGGMATVYLAQDERHGRRVAVKVLRAELARELGAERFLKEIATVAPLRHPYIVPLFDSGDDEGVLYYVMPYVEGESLRGRLTRERQLPVDAVRSIACDVAEALDCAHRAGVVHRDVKPENVLLDGSHALVTDFGVAQAVAAAGSDRLTGSGMVVGTPAYMSPEQATGDTKVDARSDVYALGCVVYEMLAGEPPFAGPTRQAILAKHANAPVPPLHIARPGMPAAAERAIEKALAKTPADRWATAGEFARVLEKAIAPADVSRATPRRRMWIASGAAAAALAIGTTAIVMKGPSAAGVENASAAPQPDTTRLVIFPLAREGETPGEVVDDDFMHDAFARWRGIVVVDRFQVADAIRQRGVIRGAGDAASIAAGLGAGRFVRGGITPRGREWRVDAALFDTRSPRALRQARIEVPPEPSRAAAAYALLADSLLLGGMAPANAPEALQPTYSLPAQLAFGRGQQALDRWDLASADSEFQTAVTLDPDAGRPNFWLAQVRVWRGLDGSSWLDLAKRALAARTQLPEREQRLADALVMLGTRRFEDACRSYERLVESNSRDFSAWFGLGQCRTLDKRVVADSTSPSGWRFRTSYRRAVEAYVRAFELLPSVHRGYERGAFEGVRVLLLISRTLIDGYGPDSALFYARPALLKDTLALVPYPWQRIVAGDPKTIPPGFNAALERQRTLFRTIAARWSSAFPQSAGAKQAVAISLELLGDPAAIDTLHHARELASESLRKTELAVAEALMRVKFGAPEDLSQLESARAIADSLLQGNRLSRSEAELAVPLASLRGRCTLSEQLARRADPPTSPFRIAPRLFLESQALLVRTSLGCSSAGTTMSATELAAAIARSQRAGSSRAPLPFVNAVLLYRVVLQSRPVDSMLVRRLQSGNDEMLMAMTASARGDTSGIRKALGAFGAHWRWELGSPTPDIALPGAILWLQAADTASAIRWLDRTLDTPSFDPRMLADPARAASFVRAMILRADLAGASGDIRTARRWGRAATTLWEGADRDLQNQLRRVRTY